MQKHVTKLMSEALIKITQMIKMCTVCKVFAKHASLIFVKTNGGEYVVVNARNLIWEKRFNFFE